MSAASIEASPTLSIGRMVISCPVSGEIGQGERAVKGHDMIFFCRTMFWLGLSHGSCRCKGIRLSLDTPPPPATYINLGWRAGPGRSTDTTTTKSSYDQYKNSFNTRVDIMCLKCTWLI